MNLNQFNRILMQTLLLPVLALSLVAGVLVWQLRSTQKTVTTIQASDEVIATATLVKRLLIDRETGLRGYQITGDERFLQPYYSSEAPMDRALHTLRDLIVAQGEDPTPVDGLRNAAVTWQVSFADPLIALTASGGKIDDIDLNMKGKQQIDALRLRVDAILHRESDLRSGETDRWRRQVRHTVDWLVLLVGAAGAIIGLFTLSRMRRVSVAYQGTLDSLRRHSQSTFDSEERLRTTLNSIGDGVIVCDAEGRLELLNPVAEKLTGWTQAEASKKPLSEMIRLISATTREPIETPVDRIKQRRSAAASADPTILIRHDDTELHIDSSGAPIYDRTGALSGIVMVFRDVTEQRRSQNSLLATEKLATASRLAASIAHEMHNPLDSVVNLMLLLRDEKDPQVSANYLDLAESELGRMGQISRAMLGLYQESKAPVRLQVKEVLDGVLTLLAHQIKEANVAVTTEFPDGIHIDGYPGELRQVFTNIVANAIEAAGTDGRISLETRRPPTLGRDSILSRPGAYIIVRDNGPGIEPDALKHIFEPFFTSKGESGTGLGLWVSRGIIDKHGGTVVIDSRTTPEDHGTTITVFLPSKTASVAV